MTTGGGAGGSVGQGLIDIEIDMTHIRNELGQMENMVDQSIQDQSAQFTALGNTIRTALVGAATAAAAALTAMFAAGAGVAGETTAATNKLQTQLGITAQEAEELGQIGKNVFANNFGGSIGEAVDAVKEVRQQLKGLADDEIQGVTEAAFGIQDAFGEEVPKTINTINTLMKDFGLTSQQATDFLTAGLQKGLNSSGDFMDTIGEYSTQFKNGGASAEQFFSLLETGLQGGVLGTDKVADSFKEFRVRIQDGSSATSDSLKMLGIDADKLAKMMASGQVTAAEAYQLVLDKLRATKDENLRMQAGVGLLGTQYEDLGQASVAALSMTTTKLDDLKGKTAELNLQYNDLPNMWASVWRSFLLSLEPAGKELLKMGQDLMPTIQQAGKDIGATLGPILVDIARGIGDVVKWFADWSREAGGLQGILQQVWDVVQNGIIAMTGLGGAILLTNRAIQAQIASSVMGALSAAWTSVTAVVSTSVVPALTTLRGVISGLLGPIGLVTAALTGLVLYANKVSQDIIKTYNSTSDLISKSTSALMGKVTQLRNEGTELAKIQAKILLYTTARDDATDQNQAAAYQKKLEALRQQEKALYEVSKASTQTSREQERHTAQINIAVPKIQQLSTNLQYNAKAADENEKKTKGAAKATDEFKKTLDGIAFAKYKESLKGYTAEELRLAESHARAAKDGDKLTAVLAEVDRRAGIATQKTQAFNNTLAGIDFDRYRESLKGYLDSQLKLAESHARAAQDGQKLNAVLAEMKRRQDELKAVQDRLATEHKRTVLEQIIGEMTPEEVMGTLKKVAQVIQSAKSMPELQGLLDKQSLLLDRQAELEAAAADVGRAMALSLQDGYHDESTKGQAPWTVTLQELKDNLGTIAEEDVPTVKTALQELADQGVVNGDTLKAAFSWLDGVAKQASDARDAFQELLDVQADFVNAQRDQDFSEWKSALSGIDPSDLQTLLDQTLNDRRDALLAHDTTKVAQFNREITALQEALKAAGERSESALKAAQLAAQNTFKTIKLNAQNELAGVVDDVVGMTEGLVDAALGGLQQDLDDGLKRISDYQDFYKNTILAAEFAGKRTGEKFAQEALDAFKATIDAGPDLTRIIARTNQNSEANKAFWATFADPKGLADAMQNALENAPELTRIVARTNQSSEDSTAFWAKIADPDGLADAMQTALENAPELTRIIARTMQNSQDNQDFWASVLDQQGIEKTLENIGSDIQQWADQNFVDLEHMTSDMAQVLLPQFERMLASASGEGLDVSGWQPFLDMLKDMAGQTEVLAEGFDSVGEEVNAVGKDIENWVTENLSDLSAITPEIAQVLLPQFESLLAVAAAEGLDTSGWQEWIDILRDLAGQAGETETAVTEMSEEMKAQLASTTQLIQTAATELADNFREILEGVVSVQEGLANALADITDIIIDNIVKQIIAQQAALAAKAIMDGAWFNFIGAAAAIAGAVAIGGVLKSITGSLRGTKVSTPSVPMSGGKEKQVLGGSSGGSDLGFTSTALTFNRAAEKMSTAADKMLEAAERGTKVNVFGLRMDTVGLAF